MIRVTSNISHQLKELKAMTSGPNSIYRKGGEALRKVLLEEFSVMVRETPQYSGSTAASWRIGMRAPTEHTEMPRPASVEEALHKGMEPACSYAINQAMGDLPPTFSLEELMRKDLIITNGAPGFEQAEGGPVRPVNAPEGPLARFEERFSRRTIITDFQK